MVIGLTDSHNGGRLSITQKIIERILSDIIGDNLPPGEKLPSERELREELQVRRSSVREALQALVALGVLRSEAGKGYFVRDNCSLPIDNSLLLKFVVEEEDFFDMLELREIIEKRIGVLAIKRATENDIENMKTLLAEMKNSLEADKELIEFTTQVHMDLAKASHNSMAVRIMALLLPLIVTKAKEAEIPPEKDFKEHKDLAQAFLNGSTEEIKKEVSQHLMYIRNRFTEVQKEKTS